MLHQRYVLLGDAALFHQMLHLGTVHALNAAFGMAYYHDLGNAQLVYGDEQAAHRTVEGACNGRSGILDDLHVAVSQAERRGQKLDQTGIHARDYGDAFVGILVRYESLVLPALDEALVELQNFVYHNYNSFSACISILLLRRRFGIVVDAVQRGCRRVISCGRSAAPR